eukprot:scaffold26683_cov47-Attheya_sp.AAC.2
MDCLCCEAGGEGPPSDTDFLGSICTSNEEAKFPAEAERYTLYVAPGCPFAARPWAVVGFYGLNEKAMQVIRCFPASDQNGWFFEPISEGEKIICASLPQVTCDKDPHCGAHHLSQLYEIAKPGFDGTVSVPLLWDAKQGTAVSNNSMSLAEMISTQMRHLGTRHHDIKLFPDCYDPEYKEHDELCHWLHENITRAPYKAVDTAGQDQEMVADKYYSTLDGVQDRLSSSGAYLMGEHIRFADMLLWISLVRLDLAYQWRFGLGKFNIRENYPVLWEYQRRIFKISGMAETVIPREIMAQYYLSAKWVKTVGHLVPLVPHTWYDACYNCDTVEMNNNSSKSD